MSTSHNGGNIQPGLDLEEHDGANNAKRVSLVSTATVFISSNLLGVGFVSTPSTWLDGGIGRQRANIRGAGLYDLETLIYGEDSTLNRLWGGFKGSSTYISTAATTTPKSAAGVLHTVTITGGTAGTIIIYDNTAGSGTILASFDSTAEMKTYLFDVPFAIGLTIVTGAATKLTVSWI